MFKKLDFFAQVAPKSIEKVKEIVLARQEKIDFDLLGRSLSQSPFLPRFINSESTICALHLNNEKKLEKFLGARDSDLDSSNLALFINTCFKNNLDLISNARTYSKNLIIHGDMFVSKYQILESVVFGADMVVLSTEILTNESFGELYNFALHLGLNVCALIRDEKELEMLDEISFFLAPNARFSAPKNKTQIYLKNF